MRFLVVSKSAHSPEVRSIVAAGKQYGDQVQIEVADITSEFIDLSVYDVVYWRSATLTHAYDAAAGRTSLFDRARQKTVLINSGVVAHPDIILKSVQQTRAYRPQSSLQTIPTFFAASLAAFETLLMSQQLMLPVMAKPNRGSRGEGVIKLDSVADFARVPQPSGYVFQNFIENSGDYRVMVVGGVAIDIVKRTPTAQSTKQYLNNVSQGGVAESVPAGLLRQKLAKFGCEIAVTFSCQVVGVDFIVDEHTGAIYFMEINTVPQWELFRPALTAAVGDAIVSLAVALGARTEGDSVRLVKEYYDTHIHSLPQEKQFHYLSRTALLFNDAGSWAKLESLRPTWLTVGAKLKQKIRGIPSVTQAQKKCSRQYRQSAHEAHYKISLYNPIFFKLLFLKMVYEQPIEQLLSACDQSDIAATYTAIFADERALFTLSTQAINFICHVQHFFPMLVIVPPPSFYLEIVARQQSVESWSAGAEIYLLTHVIIGASRFYTYTIPDPHNYVPLIQKLEQLISRSFTDISLDQKCEFLVCARLLKYESWLKKLIKRELELSLSPLGNYFVDTLNSHSLTQVPLKYSLAGSEHRSVLAIAAYTEPRVGE